jgi:predicted ATPase with chaperone activity
MITQTRSSIEPVIAIVDLPDKAFRESMKLVQDAIEIAGVFFAREHLVINLARLPSAEKVQSSTFPLP